MPRPFKLSPAREWKVHVPAPVAGHVELLLLDPLTNRPSYGARGKLVTRLLSIWLAHMTGEPLPPFPQPEELRIYDVE